MNQERVTLGTYWRDWCITARQFIQLCFDFLVALRGFSTAFDNRCMAIGELPNVVPVNVPKGHASFEKLMLKAMPNPIWQPTFGVLTSGELRRALDEGRMNNITLGIVTYFADKAAADIAIIRSMQALR